MNHQAAAAHPVVDHHFLSSFRLIVEIGDDRTYVPVICIDHPVAVEPQDVRIVPVDEFEVLDRFTRNAVNIAQLSIN